MLAVEDDNAAVVLQLEFPRRPEESLAGLVDVVRADHPEHPQFASAELDHDGNAILRRTVNGRAPRPGIWEMMALGGAPGWLALGLVARPTEPLDLGVHLYPL